jgi:2-C-methyl-D-erythritol 4-phosphate cytidylyltransferase/2-C-methyl-D-erythritol 2,4-cyclodiphosphate synthase
MNVAIIPAAGSGSRFGGQRPKQFIEIAGAPLIIHTLRRFDACRDIGGIIVALHPSEIDAFEQLLKSSGLQKTIRLVSGGAQRSDSILNALEAAKDWHPELVAVHDAVRPFVTPEQISAVLMRAGEIGAAILALPVTDTIKEVEGGLIRRTIDRRRIWRAQTPQAFRYELLMQANAEARAAGLTPSITTDDSLLVESIGLPVAVVEGSAHNIKITTREDLVLAERLFEQLNETPSSFILYPSSFRIGIGHDIHRLTEGRKLILGGVEIPFEYGLLGHSDGDSLSHAIADALLGAAGLGDIGTYFSDKDPQWKDADSLVFLQHVRHLLSEGGYKVANLDATILAERPRMKPYVSAIKSKLAEVLGLHQSQINIKAKTNEGLDAVGRGEAIAAQAIVLLIC